MRKYLELTKPRITWLIVLSTAIGYYFGLPSGKSATYSLSGLIAWRFFHALLGTGLLASGTAALNQWWERDEDARMRRTASRPIPSGSVAPARALWFGIAVSFAGFVELAAAVNWLSAWLGLATLLSYLFIYTPLKRRSWLSTTVGAFPGAMPPVIGVAAAGGTALAQAAALFTILFVWQFPHFYSIAWMYKEDYGRAGIRMLPVIEPDCQSTARQMLLWSLVLIPAAFLPALVGMSGLIYAFGSLVLGAWLVTSTFRVVLRPSRVHARAVLFASVIYLPVLYGLLLLDRSGT